MDQCQGKIRWAFGKCERPPTVTRNGKPYCWQHDPERIAARASQERAERMARAGKQEADMDAAIERSRLMKQSGIAGLTNEQLRTIIALGGIIAILERLRNHPAPVE